MLARMRSNLHHTLPFWPSNVHLRLDLHYLKMQKALMPKEERFFTLFDKSPPLEASKKHLAAQH